MQSSPESVKKLVKKGTDWFKSKGWKPFPFQKESWTTYLQGKSGLVNAPTGTGKTYSLVIPVLLEGLAEQEKTGKTPKGLRAVWITPIRALTRDIQKAAQEAATALQLDWQVSIRTGDTKSHDRRKQIQKAPQILITTPESLHLLLATKNYPNYFKNLKTVIVDEWHELVGSKRGVQMELANSRLRGLNPRLRIWGISATIGNMEEAIAVLRGQHIPKEDFVRIRSKVQKRIDVKTVLPDQIERFPWAGHLGIKLLQKVVPIINSSRTTLIFTNTRAQCEIWYQQLLEAAPDLAGQMAMHHGSISRQIRDWVENALHEEKLKAVVCTSSLDLGVDFRPVESIVQIGSPKGIARFVQRAGRSGHQPKAKSRIWFVPTHSLELIEASALREAIREKHLESRVPHIRSFDVLVQYLVTLAVSEGFRPMYILPEVRNTFSFSSISEDEWAWALDFITTGGNSLTAYDEYRKVEIEDGIYRVNSKRVALRHRLSVGTISSDASLTIKYMSGARIGTVEEWFISQLKPGDVFWFAGRSLEFVRIKDMMVQVKRSKQKTGKVPAWLGGKLDLSSQLSDHIRSRMSLLAEQEFPDPELKKLRPLVELQAERSAVPAEDEFLIEYFKDREGFHLIMYPYEGRYVHEGMSALIGYRLSQIQALSFSIAMNDYGFELLSDKPIPIREAIQEGLFSTQSLGEDIRSGVNATELARRKFRDIAAIAGLIFKGYPGKHKKDRHLQSSSQLFFEVFSDYEPNNLLLLQAYEEVMTFGLQDIRLRQALDRISGQKIIVMEPDRATPFSFPIIVDRLREKMSSERLADRIKKMKLVIET
ncbi:MAG: ligase-associated DNA damage response DEXH box helicase [Bacteroidetes bacterium]|nr:ligase-associated DNA damage response DEXH box helicase [Bacteroidota bacterium]